jgi:hypothetical protein
MLKILLITVYLAMMVDLLHHYLRSDFKNSYGDATIPLRVAAISACILWPIPVFFSGLYFFKSALSRKAT